MEKQMRALVDQVDQKENIASNLKQVEGRLADVEYELGEVEKQRDLVDDQCNNLEQQLKEAKHQGLEEGKLQGQRLLQLEQEVEAARRLEEKVKY